MLIPTGWQNARNSPERKTISARDCPGGDSHMKEAGMLVVSRGVNFGFWSHLGCSKLFRSRLLLRAKKYKKKMIFYFEK